MIFSKKNSFLYRRPGEKLTTGEEGKPPKIFTCDEVASFSYGHLGSCA